MKSEKVEHYLKKVIENQPQDWLKLTTHRLDIYVETFAKTQFLSAFEDLYQQEESGTEALNQLPTAFDYIRLGHPLSSILEWAIAKDLNLEAEQLISFSSQTIPLLAILRTNLIKGKATQVLHYGNLSERFDFKAFQSLYGYSFELKQINAEEDLPSFEGTQVLISNSIALNEYHLAPKADFILSMHEPLGSLLVINNTHRDDVAAVQHVRRRETIAMTPENSLRAIKTYLGEKDTNPYSNNDTADRAKVVQEINRVNGTDTIALLGSSGLSVQYAIMMGLIASAKEQYPNKDIKLIVPTNCYGGTNDQARRVAECLDHLEVVDLAVDGENDMVQSIDLVLNEVAQKDAIPFIIVEIPTNPRVEVPNLNQLQLTLSKQRSNREGKEAVAPVFILDQTFCPNYQFVSEHSILAEIETISYVSGSKFPSGGKCTAGYCIANEKAKKYMNFIEKQLKICDNEATPLQVAILAEQMPSMNERIAAAYENTLEFVNFIRQTLPEAKINFVSEELAKQGFTPSVFSLDLPTKGNSPAEREAYKREMNLKLINMMIHQIPEESKYCVSYGQLKGCYWTIPATSTQGTTKEADKDYIARISVSPDLDLEKHKDVFSEFAAQL